MRVVICTPSRGLIHSRTVEAVLVCQAEAQAAGIEVLAWLLSHELPIPDCHETLAARALGLGADAVWFVEEDMVPPAEALCALVRRAQATGAGVVSIDYPVGEQPTQSCTMHKEDGAIWWCGLGCTLITRAAFETVERANGRPWFRSAHDGVLVRYGENAPWQWQKTARPHVYAYGGQDIYFCYHAGLSGVVLAEVPDLIAHHARLRSWGAQQTNQGAHVVDVLREIEVRY